MTKLPEAGELKEEPRSTPDGEDASRAYRVTIHGPGITFEKSVAQGIAGQIMLLAMAGKLSDTAREAGQRDRRIGVEGQPLSVREFLNDRKLRSVPEKIAAIAYYLGAFKEQGTFKKEDIVAGFEEAREAMPANIWRDLAKTRKQGWIAPKSGERDTYYLTGTGSDAVEGNFPPEPKKITSPSRRKRGRSEKEVGSEVHEGES